MKNDNRQRYKGSCCECDKVFYACKSIGVELGHMDVGYGRCIKCNTSLALRFHEEKKTVTTILWKDYLKERKEDKYKLNE